MIFRQANAPDRQQIIVLWGQVFGDDESVIDRLLNEFAGSGNVFVAEDKDNIIAQLLTVPCEAGGGKGSYLYALATAVPYRGRGIMSELMDYARKTTAAGGRSFFVLIPAEKSLFDYYEAHDFQNIYMRNVQLDLSSEHRELFSNGKIPVELFMSLRRKHLDTDTVMFTRERSALELEEQWYYGGKAEYNDDGYIIYLTVNNTLFVMEVGSGSQSLSEKLILSAMAREECSSAVVTLPVNSGLFPFKNYRQSKITPQAQYLWWGEGPPPEFYLRFAMDDLPYRIKSNKEDVIL